MNTLTKFCIAANMEVQICKEKLWERFLFIPIRFINKLLNDPLFFHTQQEQCSKHFRLTQAQLQKLELKKIR